jgi:PEP-CTERM motif/Dockerin type I domain
MMSVTRNVWRGFAASLAVALFVGSTARADVTWILQPSTTLTFSAQVGTFTNNQFYEVYNAVPQTDNGTHLANGFTNGLVTGLTGTFKTVNDPTFGNNFLAGVNFGVQPDKSTITAANAQVVAQNNGMWLPNPTTGVTMAGTYGTPVPANVGATLVASGEYPANEVPDAGRISLTGLYGNVNSNGVAVPVSSTGHFDAVNLQTTGSLTLNLNFSTNLNAGALSLPDSGSIGNDPANGPVDSTITRGTGANAAQYIMHSNLNVTTPFIADPFWSMLSTNENVTAVANLAKGDANFDGVVNGLDVNIIASHWLQSNALHLGLGDVTGDGVVNGLDINAIAANWLGSTPALPSSVTPPISGGSGSGSNVPEPSTWVLMGLGSIGMWVLRRRAAR